MQAKPLAIAHRGASGTRPENTLAAFEHALELGCDAIELDVRLSGDGMLVVFHDDELDRLTTGRGPVIENSFAALRGLKVLGAEGLGVEVLGAEVLEPSGGAAKAAGDPMYRIPTLGEALDLVGGRVPVNVELKVDTRPELLAEFALGEVSRRDLLGSVVFSSFHAGSVEHLSALSRRARLGVLSLSGQAGASIAQASKLGAENIHPPVSDVTESLVGEAHAAGLNVWTWTADDPEEIERLARCGVDGIYSNYPDRVLAVQSAGAMRRSRRAPQ